MNPGHVELLVDVSDHVPESRRALEPGGQFPIEVTTLGQPPEAPNMQPPASSREFIRRMTAAIDDLDALDSFA